MKRMEYAAWGLAARPRLARRLRACPLVPLFRALCAAKRQDAVVSSAAVR